MIEKYGLFDSLEGDEREYAEADFARLCRAISGNGVRGGEDALKVSAAASGLAVNVAPGLAMVEGRYYELVDDGSGAFALNLAAATANPRIDRIVLMLAYGARTVTLGVLQGTEAASPEPPALTRSTAKTMLSLAQVRVAVGAGTLSDENITDERADEGLCGLHIASANGAMSAAQSALATANAAQQTANQGVTAAAAAKTQADKGVSDAAAALAEAKKRIPNVSGATEGHVAVFDASGNIKSSGKSFTNFTRATMSLSGTTLTITTVD